MRKSAFLPFMACGYVHKSVVFHIFMYIKVSWCYTNMYIKVYFCHRLIWNCYGKRYCERFDKVEGVQR